MFFADGEMIHKVAPHSYSRRLLFISLLPVSAATLLWRPYDTLKK